MYVRGDTNLYQKKLSNYDYSAEKKKGKLCELG
jgi:hypothetical protein